MMDRCAICGEPMRSYQMESSPGDTPFTVRAHLGQGTYDHGAVRMRREDAYEPYDPAEQTNGPVPTVDDLMEVGIGNEIRSTPEDVRNPYVDTTEDYKESHGDGSNRRRLFLVYLAGIVVVLAVATAAYGLLHATPWPQSWWTCLAVAVLFRITVAFGRWRFTTS